VAGLGVGSGGREASADVAFPCGFGALALDARAFRRDRNPGSGASSSLVYAMGAFR
jgi:hypothetical protein